VPIERRFRRRDTACHRQSGYSQLLRRVGVQAAIGRTFLRRKTALRRQSGCDNQLWVLAAVVWADRGIVGQTIVLNNHDFTVIGIAPEGFTVVKSRSRRILGRRARWNPGLHKLTILESPDYAKWFCRRRLKPGVTAAQAQVSLNTIASQLGREYPEASEGWRFSSHLRDF